MTCVPALTVWLDWHSHQYKCWFISFYASNCRIILMSRLIKESFHFHFLLFQPVGVVIVEQCGVTDNCLPLCGGCARSGCIGLFLSPKEHGSLRPQHRDDLAPHSGQPRSSRSTRVWPSGLFHSKVQGECSDVWEERLCTIKPEEWDVCRTRPDGSLQQFDWCQIIM